MPLEQRITLVQRLPNPLFTHWLHEWLRMADRKQSMKRVALAKALESLQRYPLPLLTGRDCCILDGFGPEICRMLDKQLAVHREAAQTMAATPDAGAVAAMPTQEEREESVREVLQIVGQRVSKERQKRRRPAEGSAVAGRGGAAIKQPSVVDLFRKYRAGGGEEETADQQDSGEEGEKEQVVVEPERGLVREERIESGSYEIILLVDTQETAGKHKRSLDVTIQELERHGVRYEVRRLSVGDFLWICRCPAPSTSTSATTSPREFVLPHIVERKRMDDLAGSIKDGRFAEQKFRLRDSGIPGVVYLVEATRAGNVGLPVPTLLQAATNTQVQSGFVVRFTQSHVDSMRYLVLMTRLLLEEYAGRSLRSVRSMRDAATNREAEDDADIPVLEFGAFAASTAKMRNFSVRDMFVRQLLQLKTLSLDKAMAIVQRYATPSRLVRAFRAAEASGGAGAAELLLAGLEFGVARRTIGPVISRCLYQLYSARQAS